MTHLSENIRLLSELLGETIREQASDRVFDTVEYIRTLCKAWRSGDTTASLKLRQIVQDLTNDLPLANDVLKAFSTYFQLVNLAEEHERIRILYERASRAYADGRAMDESMMAAVDALVEQGFDEDQVASLLDQVLIVPVFTAHPTESRRRTVRRIMELLSDQLRELRSGDTYDYQHDGIVAQLRDSITLLWQSDESRRRRPTVMDEVRNTGLYFFEHTLFDVVPRIYEELESSLGERFAGRMWSLPAVLRFGSWIGGDRDGNPFVTNHTTQSALVAQKELVLQRYSEDVQALYQLLSPARGRAGFDPDFLQQLETETASVPESELETLDRFKEEPYRQKLILLYRRLQTTLEVNQQRWNEGSTNERAFQSAHEFLDELETIQRSLCANKGVGLARGKLNRLIRRVRVFGFHLASLDIRQHSRTHQSALAEIFETQGIVAGYNDLPEADRIELLARETANRRPLTAQLNYSDDVNETISLFRLIKQAHGRLGTESIHSYIISMAERASDLLEVLLLMSDAGLFGQLNVVPLFETVDDLLAAPAIMAALFENPIYQEHLAQRKNRQQIMIGYSDSNKDGGFLRANWMLFQAQRNLAKTCTEHNVGLTLFHGRGGSIGRGGGPANRAILSQPSESIRVRIRVTEQGEVVSSRYTHPEIARRHLQQLFHAVICASGRRPEFARIGRWSEIMDQLSIAAFAEYRQLVERPSFIQYFQLATPIEHIESLNLGSRPARRRTTKAISDLRAIPWVFAWTQTRTSIPSWYGVGTGFDQWIGVNQPGERLHELREMYRDWPFFRSLMNNIHVGLGRADLDIAELYSELVQDEEGRQIFSCLRREFERACSTVLRITERDEVLDTEKWLQHSIRMRNPYVDPMNYIQVALLERFRQSDDKDERDRLQDVILHSINGIAAGLQSVG